MTSDPVTDARPEQDEAPPQCAFCERAAELSCARCDQMYCSDHGGDLCQECSAPHSVAPTRWPLVSALGTLAGGTVLGLVLLVSRPRLPSETPPAAGGALTPAATSAPARSGTAAPGATGTAAAAQKYVVKEGDTLGKIALAFSVSVDALIAANPGIRADALQVGQELTIPPRP